MAVPSVLGTPDSKTVFDCQDVSSGYNLQSHLDYLTVTGNVSSRAWVNEFLGKYFGTILDWSAAIPRHIGVKWDEFVACPLGITVALKWDEYLSVYKVRVAIPGKPLMNRKVGKAREMCAELLACGMKATRFDWAIDDYSRKLQMSAIVDAVREENYAGFSKYKIIESGKKGKSEKGLTIGLGSRKSNKYVRIYDKQIESKGEINSIRYEAEYKNGMADCMFRLYALSDDINSVHTELSKIAVGCVSFIDKVSSHLDRCSVLGWWQEFLEAVGGVMRISLPRVQRMVTQKKEWIEKKVASTIAVVCNCLGFDNTFHWLEQVVREAEMRFKSSHHVYIETWKKRRFVE